MTTKETYIPSISMKIVIMLAFVLSSIGAGVVHAQQTFNWIGSGQDTEFFHFNANWLQNQVPGTNDIARFNIGFGIPITIQFETDRSVDELLIENSEYTFRGFNFSDNTPTVLDTDRVEITGDAKLTLQNGVNGKSFELIGDQLVLWSELNIFEGNSGDFSDALVDATEQGQLTISGELDGTPSSFSADFLRIGDDENGRVVIDNGAMVNVTNTTQLGLFGGIGELQVIGNQQSTEPTRLTSGSFLISSPSTVTISGRSEIMLNNLTTINNPGEPTSLTASSPDATVHIANSFILGGGDAFFELGAQLVTSDASVSFSVTGVAGVLTIRSENAAELTSWVNSGNVDLAGLAQLPTDGGRIEIDGGIVVIGQTLKLFEMAELSMLETQAAPSILIVDTIENRDGGQFNFVEGTLSVGWYEGDLDNVAGTLAPGNDAAGNAPGRTVVLGDYFQFPDATLAMDISGNMPVAENDLLEIGGFMVAEGRLELHLLNGFVPSASDEIILASTSNIIGSFSNAPNGSRLETTDGNGSFLVNYGFASPFSPNQIVLNDFESSGFLLGDVNGDGSADLLDIAPFVDAISSGDYIPAADVNQDGSVDLFDIDPFVALLTG